MNIMYKTELHQLKNSELREHLHIIKPYVMTPATTIENNELETELQELFLIGKQWTTDLSFIECELTTLNKLFKKASFMLIKSDFDRLSGLNRICADLKNRLREYFGQLKPLITDPKQTIDFSLIDQYTLLERELEEALQRLQIFKNKIFQTNKHQLKNPSSTTS